MKNNQTSKKQGIVTVKQIYVVQKPVTHQSSVGPTINSSTTDSTGKKTSRPSR